MSQFTAKDINKLNSAKLTWC